MILNNFVAAITNLLVNVEVNMNTDSKIFSANPNNPAASSNIITSLSCSTPTNELVLSLSLIHISACHFAFFAARQAGDFATVGKAHQILAAKHCNNLRAEKPVLRVPGQKFFGSRVEGFAQSLNSVSTFAAQMKSFSDRPWMASVVYSTWQLL